MKLHRDKNKLLVLTRWALCAYRSKLMLRVKYCLNKKLKKHGSGTFECPVLPLVWVNHRKTLPNTLAAELLILVYPLNVLLRLKSNTNNCSGGSVDHFCYQSILVKNMGTRHLIIQKIRVWIINISTVWVTWALWVTVMLSHLFNIEGTTCKDLWYVQILQCRKSKIVQIDTCKCHQYSVLVIIWKCYHQSSLFFLLVA